MKKLKILLSLALVFVMIASTCVVSFASSVSHISYNETTSDEGVTTVTSSAFVAGQSKDVKLYTAVYDAEGNFVSATASNAAKTGLLKTTVTKGDGQTVKSFLWDSDNTPFYLPAVEDELSADDINDVEITIDGKPVSDYGIENLELGGEYDIDVYDYNLKEFPYVKVTSNEPTLTSSVINDTENLKTVVTIAKGSNGQETVTKQISTTGTYDVQRYSRASATITFNWSYAYIADSDFKAATNSSQNGWRYDVTTSLPLRTSKTVTLDEGESFKAVSVKFASYTKQQVIVVVKPASTAAANYIADPKSIVVASDGSALTWVNDTNMVYDYVGASEGYNAGNVVCGKKTGTNPANALGTNVAVYWPVQDVLTDSDTGYETGSRTTTARRPDIHQRQIYNLGENRDLAGYAYVVAPDSTVTDGVVTFYIADDAEIVTISPNTTVTYSVAGGEYVAADASSTNKPVTIIYTNNASASDVAWLIKKGYIYPSDISQTNANSNKNHELEDGTTVNPVSYTLRTWNYIYKNPVLPQFGYALCDEWARKKNYTYDEILALWKDYEFETDDTEFIKDFNAPSTFAGVGTFRYPENMSDYNKEEYAETRKLYENYTYSVDASNGKAVLLEPGFPGKTAYADRDGEDNANGTGTVISYPEALGLEDDYYILPVLNAVNGARFGGLGMDKYSGIIEKLSYSDVWRQVKGQEWASFTVTRDAKVTVLANSLNNGFTMDTEGWDFVDLGGDALILLQTYSNNGKASFRYAYTKHYPAGSKITLVTPGAGILYTTFIDEWDSDSEHSADLAGITIDGVALDGFDAATTEYNYTVEINDMSAPVIEATAADAAAKVKIVNPAEFPGSAKIKINNCGNEKIYTINYVLDASAKYASNVVMSSEVNFGDVKAVLVSNLQLGDKTYNDRLTNGNMVFSKVASEYVGREWLRGCLGWQNDPETNDYKVKWIQDEIISDWVSFDICRSGTIHLVSEQSSASEKGKYMLNNGWRVGVDNSGYLVGYTAAVTPYPYRYTKHFDVDPVTGKATVQIPNIGGKSIFAIIIPDGWTE